MLEGREGRPGLPKVGENAMRYRLSTAPARLALVGRRRSEEKCLCGHRRAKHGLWLEAGAGLVALEMGGGTCQCGRCQCERFRSAILACREHG
jgi:hypothetical protein